MESLKVRDIMQVEVVTIGPEASVRELSVLLGEKGVSGVPVVDGQGKVVGVVSEGDVILQDAELHFPHYVQFLDSVIFLESVQRFAPHLELIECIGRWLLRIWMRFAGTCGLSWAGSVLAPVTWRW